MQGKAGAYLDSIQFVTNQGRLSPVYGGGGGETNFLYGSNGDPVGALECVVSARGWIARLRGLVPLAAITVPVEIAAETRRTQAQREQELRGSVVARHRHKLRAAATQRTWKQLCEWEGMGGRGRV